MAIINVSYDTNEKTMTMTMDGEVVPDVVGCTLGRDYGDPNKWSCEFLQRTADKDNDIVKVSRTMASETERSLADEVAAWRKRG